jgi:UMP-CMP kinase
MPAITDKIANALHLHSRNKDEHHAASSSAQPEATGPIKSPVFDSSKVTVLFVLGGPGVGKLMLTLWLVASVDHLPGKGTQCANLVNDFGFCHLSGTTSDPFTHNPTEDT